MAGAPPTSAGVNAALRRLAASGYSLDAHDKEHQQAYLLCRQRSNRVKGEDVLACLESTKHKSDTGIKVSTVFFAVPRSNFANQLPQALGKYLVSEEELQANYVQGEEPVEMAAFFILDPSAPATELGLRVRQVSFFHKVGKVMEAPPGAATGAQASVTEQPQAQPQA